MKVIVQHTCFKRMSIEHSIFIPGACISRARTGFKRTSERVQAALVLETSKHPMQSSSTICLFKAENQINQGDLEVGYTEEILYRFACWVTDARCIEYISDMTLEV